MIVCAMLVGAGCSGAPAISPATLVKERARQDVNRLNARVIRAHQERQQAVALVQHLQTRLRHPGLSAKERTDSQADLEEANRQVADASEHLAELEEELSQEWVAYRAQYGEGDRLAGPMPRTP